MAGNFLQTSLQTLWNEWNIRGFILFSLFLQLFLAFFGRLRRKSTNRVIISALWMAYFMANWAALFTLGLISNAQRIKSINPLEVNQTLLAFWAAFLLIHLGGPDTITAFSLEDNALWLRHLVGFVAQLFAFFYVFLKTLPENNLAAPTVLVAIAGVIKFGERVRALRLASMQNLKKSFGEEPPKFRFSEDREIPRYNQAFYFFQISKGLFVDISPNHAQRSEIRDLFQSITSSRAFSTIQIELDFLYEVFYTKILALNSFQGVITRSVASYNILAALILYCISSKDGLHNVDIWITYLLYAGVFALETLTGIVIIVESWKYRNISYCRMYSVAQGVCFIVPLFVISVIFRLLDFCGIQRDLTLSWCKNLGSFNLVAECFERCRRRRGHKLKRYSREIIRFFMDIIDEGVSRNAFSWNMWDFIFNHLKESASDANDADKVREIFESNGYMTLKKLGNNDDLVRYVKDIDYGKSILAWHVATEICYNIDGSVDSTRNEKRKFAKTLSDYMHYLLMKKPELMSAVAGIGHIRFRDTCAEMEHFCEKLKAKTVQELCVRVVDEITSIELTHEPSERRTSILRDACHLAKVLRQKDEKWGIISRVWVELLSYAAGHCRAEAHARVRSQGGEFITFIWLLMAHFGIGPHFPSPED